MRAKHIIIAASAGTLLLCAVVAVRSTMPPPVGFNAPDRQHVTHGTRYAPPLLVKAAGQLIAGANARNWAAVGALTCPSLRGNVSDLITGYSSRYDENLPASAIRHVGSDFTLTGASIEPASNIGLVFARESFTRVPPRYKDYFGDITYTATMNIVDGGWKMCGLAATFTGG